jgi:transcriptional regulator, propionate catabolism operon regulatory protein
LTGAGVSGRLFHETGAFQFEAQGRTPVVIHIKLVAPYREIAVIGREALAEIESKNVELDVVETASVRAARQLNFDNVDALISRGVTYMGLRTVLPTSMPMIELKVTGYDILRAVHHCWRQYGGSKLSVIGSRNMVEGAQSVADILKVDLYYGLITGEEDAEECIEDGLRNGAQVVIGGELACGLARKRGVNCCLIESNRDSIVSALKEAAQAASIASKERMFAVRMRAMMDVLDEGIVAVDERGVIETWNAAAAHLFGFQEPILGVGKPARDVFPDLNLEAAVRDGKRITTAIHRVGQTNVVANLVPLFMGQRIIGGVARFEEIGRNKETRDRRGPVHTGQYEARYRFSDCHGTSLELRNVIDTAGKYASTEAAVLIFGETGTGKEIIAQGIHNASPRKKGPFVAVNCAALVESLLESELFGYVGGAFTGATKSGKPGLFELAHNGTIFLDEISEIPPRLQSKLLRVLQEQEVMRIGDDKTVQIDVRVIAATNRDVKSMARDGQFREDLLYRLDVLEISIPPLRERPGDVRILSRLFLDEYGRKLARRPYTICDGGLAILMAHDWPGNVRELRNICERLCVLAEMAEITAAETSRVMGLSHPVARKTPGGPGQGVRADLTIRELSAQAVKSALSACNGNRSRAAQALGISRSTLWRLLQRGSSAKAGRRPPNAA